MAWTPLYLEANDVNLLNNWLNDNEEIAFLVANGTGKWIAKMRHNILADNGTQTLGIKGTDFLVPNFIEYNLWHIPSGQLPLLGDSTPDSFIDDPWIGWTEIRQGANRNKPYFGVGHTGIISLNIRLADKKDAIPMSDFQWIGNHYKMIGYGADKSTELFWNKLRRMLKKTTTQIPRCNDLERKREIFTFPSAHIEIINGRPCSLN